MPNYSKRLLEKTITAWQPFSLSILLEEDAREITENVIGLFSLLSEWTYKNDEKTKNKKEKNEGISLFGVW